MTRAWIVAMAVCLLACGGPGSMPGDPIDAGLGPGVDGGETAIDAAASVVDAPPPLPCTCPAGYQCERDICVGGDPAAFAFDVKTVPVSGAIRRNGVVPTSGPRCVGRPDEAKAELTLYDRRREYLFQLPVPCSSEDFAVSGQVYPGEYVIGGGRPWQSSPELSNLYDQVFFADTRVTVVDSPVTGVVADVPMHEVSGVILHNGVAPQSLCETAPPTSPKARIVLVGVGFGGFDHTVTCASPEYAWRATMFPGTYDVRVERGGYTDLPGVARPSAPLVVSGDAANQVIDARSVEVSGHVTFHGRPLAKGPGCSRPYARTANVVFEELDHGYELGSSLAAVYCDSDDEFRVRVPPGRFRVLVEGDQSDLPPERAVVIPELVVRGDLASQHLDVRTAEVRGAISKNGVDPVVLRGCQNPVPRSAIVRLTDAANGYEYAFDVPCTAPHFAWRGAVFPGTYDITVEGASGEASNLPYARFLGRTAVAVNADVDVGTIDVRTIEVHGRVLQNGATPATPARCTGTPAETKAVVRFARGPTVFELPVRCDSAFYFWAGTLYPGTYDVTVGGFTADSSYDSPFAIDRAMRLDADAPDLRFDVKTVDIGGTITLNGGTAPVSCPDRTATKALIVLVDAAQGYRLTLEVPCMSPMHRWTGRVYPGTYEVHVSGDYRDGGRDYTGGLPKEPYLVAPRLAIP